MFRHRGVSDNDTATRSRRARGGYGPIGALRPKAKVSGQRDAVTADAERLRKHTHSGGDRSRTLGQLRRAPSQGRRAITLCILSPAPRFFFFFLITALSLGRRRVETYLGRGGGYGGRCAAEASVAALDT